MVEIQINIPEKCRKMVRKEYQSLRFRLCLGEKKKYALSFKTCDRSTSDIWMCMMYVYEVPSLGV